MKFKSALVALCLPVLLGSCSLLSGPHASANMIDPAGSVIGNATFTPDGNGLHIKVRVNGMQPGQHGMHIHEKPSCDSIASSDSPYTLFMGAGGHFDPGGAGHHASPDATNDKGHAGDLPMLTVGTDGVGVADFHTDRLTLNGATGVVGHSIIIHADPDDYKTDPAGNSGKRFSCGIIR